MAVLRDHYFKLGSELPKERLNAATLLISELVAADNEEEWSYALNRLLKGILTTRQSAKFGFSMALTEVVNELNNRGTLTVGKYLDLLVETTKLTSSMKGKEQRAVLFGRLFGLQVLINSQIIILKSEPEDMLQFVEILMELSNFKNWIRETGIFTLIQFIKLLENSNVEYSKKIYIKILNMVNNLGLNLSTEGLAIYLSIPQSAQLSQNVSNMKANWKNGDPFYKGNLPVLAKVLKDVEVISDEETGDDQKKKNQQKSSWNSRLPFVWDLIVAKFNQVADDSNVEDEMQDLLVTSKKRKKTTSPKHNNKRAKIEPEYISLKEFWKVVVDETLFSEKSSNERKYWGFEIFTKFVTSLETTSLVQYLFTPNFMRCLINQHASSTRMLYKIAQQTLKTLVKTIRETKPELGPIVLLCLLDESKGGCWNFDLISKSHTIDEILQIKTNVNQYINILLENFTIKLQTQTTLDDTSNNNKNSNDNILKWYLDKIVSLIKHNNNNQHKLSDTVLESILTKLLQYSFFDTNDIKISKFLQSICKEKFNSILSEIITLKLSHRNYKTWSTFCYKIIDKLSQDPENKCLVEFDDEISIVKQETAELLSTIIELNTKSSDKLYIFELMFSMCLIQLYMEDEETIQVINELKLVFENQFTTANKDENEEDDNKVDDNLVLTEIVLSFISRKSTLFKKLSVLVWENFLCQVDEIRKLRVNEACFKLLFDVLEAKENKQGQEKLFEGDGEFQEGDGDEEDEEEDEEAEEAEDNNENDSSSDIDSDSNNDSDSDNVSESDNNEDTITEIDKQTNLKLAQALGIPTKESGEVKFDELDDLSSDDDYESDSMDDEQMMAMDDQLSKIFKQRQDTITNLATGNKRKLEVLEAKENMIFFKNRVLDLLETFNKVAVNLHFNLAFIEPLINLMNLTLDKNLGVKAHKLLKNKISKTKIDSEELKKYYNDDSSEYYHQLINLIEELQTKANTTQPSNQSVVQSYNQSCIIIAKNLLNLDESNMQAIVDIYCNSLKQWCLQSESKLQPSLFFDFINWVNSKKSNASHNQNQNQKQKHKS